MDEALERYSHLLDHIYGAALLPERWPQAVQALARWLKASKALLFTPMTVPAQGGFFYTHGLSAQDMTLWAQRYQVKDFWLERAIERGLLHEGSVITDGDICTESELLQSEWYRHFLVKLDIGRLTTGIIVGADHAEHCAVACSFFRSLEAPAFTAAEKHALGLLMPHLSRALTLMFRLRDAEHRSAASEAALNALSCGVLLFEGGGQLVFANRAARSLAQQGLGLSISEGRLRLEEAREQRRFQAAFSACLAPPGEGLQDHHAEALLVGLGAGTGPCLLQLSPLPRESRFSQPAGAARVVGFLTEGRGRAQHVDPALLRDTWGLSPAEARTAAAMSEGGRLEDIASQLGLSSNTLKSQLKQVYQKTGCTSRSDLSRLMLSLGVRAAEQG